MKKTKISIIIPAYDEEEGIVKTLKSIPLKKLKRLNYLVEVIVIDNNSKDKTSFLAKKLGARVVKEKKQGYGYSYKKGLSIAKGDILVTLDGDGTYPIKDLLKLLKIFEKNKLDFMTTNRFGKKYLDLAEMPFLNRFGNLILSYMLIMLFRINIKDSQSGMWIFRKSLLKKLKIRSNQMGFSQEIKIEAIFFSKSNWLEIDINYEDRVGSKKLRILKDGMGNIMNLITKRLLR